MKFDFSKNQTIAADVFESTVPADFRSLYKADGDNHVLDNEDPKVKSAVSAITGLSKALNAERATTADLKSKVVDLSSLSDFGDSPDSIKSAFEKKLAEVQKAAKGAGSKDIEAQIAKVKEEMNKTHAKELEGSKQKAEALKMQLNSIMVDGEAKAALAKHNAHVDLALPHILKHVKVTEEDGQFKVNVVDPDGTTRYDGTGNPMSVAGLVEDMKSNKDLSPLFKSEAPAGGGTPPGAPGRRTTPTGVEKSSTEKISSGLDKLGKTR